jgi:ATP-binding protein involved in chromosome partitioning
MRLFKDGESCAPLGNGSGGDAVSQLQANLAAVKVVVAIASARGGVGKSTTTVNLAAALAQSGRKIGVIDADLNSPSILAMLGIKAPRRPAVTEWIEPLAGPLGIRVAGVDLLPDLESAPISFLDIDDGSLAESNGPVATEVGYSKTLRRLFEQTRLGALDLLLIDLPPGIEPTARLIQMVPQAALLIITHPSGLSARATRTMGELAAAKEATVVAIIENMAGFCCENCHSVRPLMPQGAVAPVAHDLNIPLLERLAFDPRLAEATDRGTLFVREYSDTPLAKQLVALAQVIDSATKPKVASVQAAAG